MFSRTHFLVFIVFLASQLEADSDWERESSTFFPFALSHLGMLSYSTFWAQAEASLPRWLAGLPYLLYFKNYLQVLGNSWVLYPRQDSGYVWWVFGAAFSHDLHLRTYESHWSPDSLEYICKFLWCQLNSFLPSSYIIIDFAILRY